ncbi:hypothetical protein CDCA_CDCA01G0333 [Cyanidium caldarium]|uniref:RCC1-like domain-containing protein n=1 Tax=Cyanidium caldarium TaxID=2771 RepID=A0AAV9IQK2_CYACA|nr:hypothetical protein CDCA_CDCA01G0333 [Cyanidium caldarium]
MTASQTTTPAQPALLFCGSNKWDTHGRDRKDAIPYGTEVLAPHRLVGGRTLGVARSGASGRDGAGGLATLSAVVKVRSGPVAGHAVLVLSDGRALALGRNTYGELGAGTRRRFAPVFLPVALPRGAMCVDVACGKTHTLFLTRDGEVYAAGANDCGQLGLGKDGGRPSVLPATATPVRLSHLADEMQVRVQQVACGENFSMLLSEEGDLYTFGTHRDGVLGHGTNGEVIEMRKVAVDFEPTPRRIVRLIGSDGSLIEQDAADAERVRFVQVVCGQRHAAALDSTGRVWTWGFGGYGRLGHRVPKDEWRPRSIEIFERFRSDRRRCTKLYAGAACCYALTELGALYFWGTTSRTSEATTTPQMVYDLHGWRTRSVSVGLSSTMVACEERATVAWGPAPAHGEMGFGDTVSGRNFGGHVGISKSSTHPRIVEPLQGVQVTEVAMGAFFTLLWVSAEDAAASEGDGAAVSALPELCWDADADIGSEPTNEAVIESGVPEVERPTKRGRKKKAAAGNAEKSGSKSRQPLNTALKPAAVRSRPAKKGRAA